MIKCCWVLANAILTIGWILSWMMIGAILAMMIDGAMVMCFYDWNLIDIKHCMLVHLTVG